MSGDILKVENLSKSYGSYPAVKGVSFTVRAGEMRALIGPNGAGKSTCFNMLMGQIRPSGGKIWLNGAEITGERPREIWRRGVGRTFQVTGTYQSMTVLENVQMALISHNHRIYSFFRHARDMYRAEAMALLDRVGMAGEAERPCSVLAYGDLKKLELAIALAHGPKLLLMDEPTAGMAPSARIALMQLTADIVKQEGLSVLFTEHDMDVVFAHADRIMVLNHGELIADGNALEVRADPQVQKVYLGGGMLFEEIAHA